MDTQIDNRSYLVKLKVCNFGCIGPDGVEVELDEIVCLVGANNCGKSTILRAYEAAASSGEIAADEVFNKELGFCPDFVKLPPTVELWAHIPDGAENIDAKWKEDKDGMRLVRSKWTWSQDGGRPTRETWDPQLKEYAENGKAAGLDTVFNSRLPRPFRIGSLDNPEEEHKRLLDLILEPIKTRLALLMKDKDSDLHVKAMDLQAAAQKPVSEFQSDLESVQSRVNSSYSRVFNSAQIRLSVSLGELSFDPSSALGRASHFSVVETHGGTRWHQQGTGSQRTLFWSMLEVRSELNRIADERRQLDKKRKDIEKSLLTQRKKLTTLKQPKALENCRSEIADLEAQFAAISSEGGASSNAFLPGYMLLIDEPETALHPAAIRAAKDHLYSLALESGWQVMLSTHHPAFIDPTKDHTTIVRLHRSSNHAAPNVYRSDAIGFSGPEKETLKTLLAFDQSVSEMFFSQRVIVVEGDTEFASFMVAMDKDSVSFPQESRPLILRARGKWTIPILVRMLAHFKVPFAVLHDVDSPRTGSGKNSNGAYTANAQITSAINEARESGVFVVHRCSEPDFERKHGLELPSKDKPFNAWKAVQADAIILGRVRKVLNELCLSPSLDAANHEDDGRHYEAKCKEWAKNNAKDDPAFRFD